MNFQFQKASYQQEFYITIAKGIKYPRRIGYQAIYSADYDKALYIYHQIYTEPLPLLTFFFLLQFLCVLERKFFAVIRKDGEALMKLKLVLSTRMNH